MIYVVFLESFMNWVVWSFFFFFLENNKTQKSRQQNKEEILKHLNVNMTFPKAGFWCLYHLHYYPLGELYSFNV